MSTPIVNAVVVRGLPLQWTDDAVKNVFQSFGEVTSVTFPRRRTYKPKAGKPTPPEPTTKTAFVQFANENDVIKASATPEFDFSDEQNNISGKFSIAKWEEREKKVRAPKKAKAPKATNAAAATPAAAKKTKRGKKAAIPAEAQAIVARGLHPSLTKDLITKTFESFGEVAKVVITKRRTFRRAGAEPVPAAERPIVVFIAFKDQSGKDKALATPQFDLEIGDLKCNITLAAFEYREPRQPKAAVAKAPGAPKAKKQRKKKAPIVQAEPESTAVFHQIPMAATEDEIKAVAAKFGEVKSIRFVGLRNKHVSKVAFLQFASPAEAAAAVAAGEVTIKEEKVLTRAFSVEPPARPVRAAAPEAVVA